MKTQILSVPNLHLIIVAVIGGTFARLATLREDYRQYPSYPNGYLGQAVLGFISATLGAVSIPALMTNNFTAVTFFTLALTQFQNVRRQEQASLQLLEETEYTKRGNAYIDGIAKTFEARNYISLFVALTIGIVMQLMHSQDFIIRITCGVISALLVYWGLTLFAKGQIIADIAEVKEGKVTIQNNELYVDDIFISNKVGVERGQEMILQEGLAVVIFPKEQHYRIALDNYGQRQAILFEITRSLGIKRYHFTRKNYEDGRIVFFIVPLFGDIKKMIEVARHTPVLESLNKSHIFLKRWENRHERS
ncbi:YIEGIA domain-containing protein [Bacillus sp. 165]|uniref:YIEGIA domain-containing protein n=1 Tax=Bacillus sp. 165 TaxID=1529117 RepID=UPI001ADC7372|nr:YIEGIA domain-containing protein [Bacillus sp. 165]MBO9131496.1 YIEGIA domain-containing protein [Bacillus sp. 165]